MTQTTGEKILQYLAAFELKSEGSGNYRCNSPLRPGANSHSFTIRIDASGETGAWMDHAGGESGGLYNLAERLKIAVESRQEGRRAVSDSLTVYRNLKEYATLKGVPEDVFLKAKWSPEPVMTNNPGTKEMRPAFEFPTLGGKRYRFTDGKKPKFKSEKGYKTCWYGLKQAVDLANKISAPLVLCNGEPSVLVALHFRVPACAITGGEQPTIPAALLQELKSFWAGKTIIVAMDCDEAGRASAAGKAKILRAAGFIVKVIDLGLDDKGDLADLCKLHTDSTMAQIFVLAADEPAGSTPEPKATDNLPNLLKELAAARRKGESDESLSALLDKIDYEVKLSRKATKQPNAVQSFGSLVKTRHKRLDEAMKNPQSVQGLRSGINKLDELIGGFVPGRMHTFYGDTGMGKSTMVTTIATNFSAQAAGIIIPTESMPGDYLDKLAAYKANIPFDLIETGQLTNEQYRTVMAAYAWLEEKNCHFFDSLSPTTSQIRTEVLEGIEKYNYQWVIIDSVNNLSSVLHDDLYGKTSEAADFVQELAHLGLVVVDTSQIGRNMKDRKNKIPKLNDALGSGKIEQNSDVVMACYNHQYYVDEESAKPDDRFPPGSMLVKCLKHRWRGNARGKSKFLAFKGGIGVYD